MFMRQKKYETNRAKGLKMLIVRWKSKDALIRVSLEKIGLVIQLIVWVTLRTTSP